MDVTGYVPFSDIVLPDDGGDFVRFIICDRCGSLVACDMAGHHNNFHDEMETT